MLLFVSFLLAISSGSVDEKYVPTLPASYPADFDCPMRQLALQFAIDIQPNLSKDQLQEIADALNGAQESVNKTCVQVPSDWQKKHKEPSSWNDLIDVGTESTIKTASIFVDFNKGNDNNDGSLNKPLKYLDTAIDLAQKLYGTQYKRIILREGRHYLRTTIDITSDNNNLLITNYNKENVELSGATPIKCTWEHAGGHNESWNTLPNTDGIWGGPPGPGQNSTDGIDIYIGQANSFEECKNMILPVYKQYGFGAFTWESSAASGWQNVCYGIVGSNYRTNSASYATTGVLVNAANIYSCKITDNTITNIMGIRVNGTRGIRARYPNGNPEVFPCGFCSNLDAHSWFSTCTAKPDTEYHEGPKRNTTQGNWFEQYQMGVGGCCSEMVPPAGYWCGDQTQGGGAFTYVIPSGIDYSGVLPNAPYKDITGGVIQAWRPAHWSSWMFLLDPKTYDPAKSTIQFIKGGFQGARGSKSGGQFYIENIREELDYPTEWFYNTSTKTLYYVQNGTGTPANTVFEATNLKILVNYTGTMSKPVENQVLRGMTLRDTQYTYLDGHGMPSGGDWGLERTGAVYLDGVKNIQIINNTMTRLDGNAISVNRYARDVVIEGNEIVWQGDSAVTQWGDTENISMSDGSTMGYDGTNGNQPRGTVFRSNFVHEIGIWEKQSSMWFQAKSCSNILENNIFFNGPRAGINFNDGFGGNSTLKKNLLFNTCRESGDHGPFNSWDRQMYVTSVRDGTPSNIKEYDHIYNNFMIADYSAGFAIDNDDGSCYYDTHDNFFVYGNTGMKNDFGGHDNHHYNNIYGYIGGHCFGINGQIEGHQDMFYNNTCIINQNKPSQYASFDCGTQNSNNQWPKLGNNKIYQLSTDTGVTGLCGQNEKTFQQKNPGVDDATTINGPPNNGQILQQAKQLIF